MLYKKQKHFLCYKNVAFAFIGFFCLLIFACNNQPQTPIKEDTTAVDSSNNTSQAAAPLVGKLYKLKLFDSLYRELRGSGSDKSKKLVFVFYFDDDQPTYPTLVAYGTKQSHYERRKDSVVLTPDVQHLTLPKQKFLGNQEVLIKEIDAIIDSAKVPSGQRFDHLLFTPNIDTKKHIYYVIEVVCPVCPTQLFTATTSTNPSPPKGAQ